MYEKCVKGIQGHFCKFEAYLHIYTFSITIFGQPGGPYWIQSQPPNLKWSYIYVCINAHIDIERINGLFPKINPGVTITPGQTHPDQTAQHQIHILLIHFLVQLRISYYFLLCILFFSILYVLMLESFMFLVIFAWVCLVFLLSGSRHDVCEAVMVGEKLQRGVQECNSGFWSK